jgi:hypothetical protein
MKTWKWFAEVRNCWFLGLSNEVYIVLNEKRFENGEQWKEDCIVVSLVDLVSLRLCLMGLLLFSEPTG